MATMRVDPRPTPAERANERIDVEVDEALTVLAATLEDWAAPRQQWELQLREGHDSGRGNEERDGIAKLARLDANGLHVELFHILTFT
jgi:hypothetical protein